MTPLVLALPLASPNRKLSRLRSGGLLASFALAFVASLAGAPRAVAVDGVIEINQASARGVFPVRIDQAGSYRLTGNLRPGDINRNAILITAPNVTLDLNGFEIAGEAVCTLMGMPPQLVCSQTGTGDGVFAVGVDNVTVLNGTIRNFRRAVNCEMGDRVRISGVSAHSNSQRAFVLGADGLVSDSTASDNADSGMEAGARAQVRRVNASRNNGHGLIVGDSSIVEGCIAETNGMAGVGDGIRGGGRCVVSGNTANGNRDTGIAVIGMSGGSILRGNVCFENRQRGLNLGVGAQTLYFDNVLGANMAGGVTGNGVQLCPSGGGPRNICDAAAGTPCSCP